MTRHRYDLPFTVTESHQPTRLHEFAGYFSPAGKRHGTFIGFDCGDGNSPNYHGPTCRYSAKALGLSEYEARCRNGRQAAGDPWLHSAYPKGRRGAQSTDRCLSWL